MDKRFSYEHIIADKLKKVYSSMKQRCSNPNGKNYHRYGGKGIKVCPKWRAGFIFFYVDAVEPFKKFFNVNYF